MTLDELLALSASEEGHPAIADFLANTSDTAMRADSADAKIAEQAAAIADLERAVTELKSANYDLIQAAGVVSAGDTADDAGDDDPNDGPTLEQMLNPTEDED